MSAVIAVLLVVVCDPDLVHCSPVETWERSWDSVESCRLHLDEKRQFKPSLLAKSAKPSDLLAF